MRQISFSLPFSISIILSAVVNNFADNVKKDMTIIAFLDVDITDERIKEIETEIKNFEKPGSLEKTLLEIKDSKNAKFISFHFSAFSAYKHIL